MPAALAPLLVIGAGVLWGFLGFFTRTLSAAGFSSVQITFTRCLIASASLIIFLLLSNPNRLKVNPRHLWYFIGSGILSLALFNICYFRCIDMLTLSAAAMLLYTCPFFVIIMSAFVFQEKLSFRKGLSLIMAFTGCLLVIGLIGDEQVNFSTTGILLGLGAGFGYALYSIFARIALAKYDAYTVTTYTFGLAALALACFADLPGIAQLVQQNPRLILVALGMGILCTLIPYTMYTAALKYMEAGKASITGFTEPMMATVCGIIFFGELLTWQSFFGIMMIFMALILLNLNPKITIFKA